LALSRHGLIISIPVPKFAASLWKCRVLVTVRQETYQRRGAACTSCHWIQTSRASLVSRRFSNRRGRRTLLARIWKWRNRQVVSWKLPHRQKEDCAGRVRRFRRVCCFLSGVGGGKPIKLVLADAHIGRRHHGRGPLWGDFVNSGQGGLSVERVMCIAALRSVGRGMRSKID